MAKRVGCAVFLCGATEILFFADAAAQTPTSQHTPTAEEIEAEVAANILNQPLGDLKVEVLNLPAQFVHRVADRVIRSSYEDQYRIVVPDPASQPSGSSPVIASGASERRESVTPATTAGSNWVSWIVLGLGGIVIIVAGLSWRGTAK